MAFRGPRPHFVIVDEAAEFPAAFEPSMPPPERRGMDGDDQLVEVNHKYGYAWPGPGFLEVGDVVVLPGASGRSWWIGKVTDIGSPYTGQFKRILRKATAGDMEAYRRRVEEDRRRSGRREFSNVVFSWPRRAGKQRWLEANLDH